MLIFDPNARIRYTLESERDTPGAAVFILAPPTHGWMQTHGGSATAVGIVEEFLKGWEGLVDASGAAVAMPETGKTDLLHWTTIQELARRILELATLTKEDKGK